MGQELIGFSGYGEGNQVKFSMGKNWGKISSIKGRKEEKKGDMLNLKYQLEKCSKYKVYKKIFTKKRTCEGVSG